MITSRTNPSVKRIRALRSRKERDETGLFFVEGIRIVGEAVEKGAAIETAVFAPDLLNSRYGRELIGKLEERNRLMEVSADVFRSISTKDGPQGIGAVIRQRWESLDTIDPSEDFCWVALDAVQDPGNLGSIMRTSDAVGGSGIVLIGSATDPHDPSALRAAMGAIFSQRLIRAELDELASWALEKRCMLVGTSDAAETDYIAARYQAPIILIAGSEQKGLSEVQQAGCDIVVSLPMVGRSDSLNLSVATGVILYEMFNQRRHARCADNS